MRSKVMTSCEGYDASKTPIMISFPKQLVVALCLTMAFVSCSSDDDNSDRDAVQAAEIENFISSEVQQTLERFNFEFVLGTDDVDLSGTFLFDPLILVDSNIENDTPAGSSFNSILATFSNLDPVNRTLDYTDNSDSVQGASAQSYYTACGNQFNVFVRVTNQFGESTYVTLRAVSGTMDETGIIDARLTEIMLDDQGDSFNILIENGEGRLFEDSDGLATRIE